MTTQTGPGGLGEAVISRRDIIDNSNQGEQLNLVPEDGSVVRRIGKKGFQ